MTMPKVGYRGSPRVMKAFQDRIRRYNKNRPREKHIKAADILEKFMKKWRPPKR